MTRTTRAHACLTLRNSPIIMI